jgi:hypothetical protein
MELIHEDRREDRRYPIEMQLRYKVTPRGHAPLLGAGRTLNVSSGGVVFNGDQSLPAGASVELSIDWPVRLENNRPLTLLVVGHVVRCEYDRVAVKMHHYEFFTRPARNRVLPEDQGRTYIA